MLQSVLCLINNIVPTSTQVRLYDLMDGNGFRCIHEMDVGQILQRYLDTKEQSTALLEDAGMLCLPIIHTEECLTVIVA